MRKLGFVLSLFLLSVSLFGYDLINPAAVSVTAAGTAEQLTSLAQYKNCRSIYIESDDGNTGAIYVGNSSVSSTRYAAKLPKAGDGVTISTNQDWVNATSIYVDADVTAESVQWSALCSQ